MFSTSSRVIVVKSAAKLQLKKNIKKVPNLKKHFYQQKHLNNRSAPFADCDVNALGVPEEGEVDEDYKINSTNQNTGLTEVVGQI